MKSFALILIAYFLLLFASAVYAQDADKSNVVITGVRFAYPLVEKWIHDYKEANPDANVVIESRTTTDPASYDLLIEAYEPEKSVKETRDYLSIGRYALLPFANASSAFAKIYGEKGLTNGLIKQIYFHDIYADQEKKTEIKAPYTVYTRLQKAGAPITFARYFGYEQQNITGRTIAGADEHLIKAILKDSSGVSYSTPGLLFDQTSRKPHNGLTIIPVDLDDNGRVSDSERITGNLDAVISKLENDDVKNIPVEYLHFSLSKVSNNPEALKFLLWVIYNGQDDLHQFGYLKPDPRRFDEEKEKFEQRASR
jgi:ABC-type phosphate transport system substrate-binding protein